jgi:hypothetical protein
VELTKYSIGVGDRFAHQAKAQLLAIIKAEAEGVLITPVWNKSFREHQIIKSLPGETRREVDSAVKSLKWEHPYFVDADHVGFKTIDHFISSCDFYTLDVADFIGRKTDDQKIKSFVYKNRSFCGTLDIPGLIEKVEINEAMIFKAAEKFLFAVEEAGKVYRHLLEKQGKNNFVVEISLNYCLYCLQLHMKKYLSRRLHQNFQGVLIKVLIMWEMLQSLAKSLKKMLQL